MLEAQAQLLVRRLAKSAAAIVAGVLVAACGGGDDETAARPIAFGKTVVFGDSLSDVGTHRTPGVAALGGGKYTVNSADARIWVERVAEQSGTPAPCAARVGLMSRGLLAPLAAPPADVPNCFDYAQGGSRVTEPIGPFNSALPDPQGAVGQLTEPVSVQINRHLAKSNNAFDPSDLVLVLAGGNDVIMNLSAVGAGGATPTSAVTAMASAGAQLASMVKTLVVGRGAKQVVVVNMPDFSKTPAMLASDAPTQSLALAMSSAFNEQLAAGLAGVNEVLLVDAFARSQSYAANPAQAGISNATAPACALSPAVPASLFCTTHTLIAGDTSRYLFADTVHPTPYGYMLLADLVLEGMRAKGWL